MQHENEKREIEERLTKAVKEEQAKSHTLAEECKSLHGKVKDLEDKISKQGADIDDFDRFAY